MTLNCLCGLWPLGGVSGVIDIAVGVGGSLVLGSNASLTRGKEACLEDGGADDGKVLSLSFTWGEAEVWRERS